MILWAIHANEILMHPKRDHSVALVYPSACGQHEIRPEPIKVNMKVDFSPYMLRNTKLKLKLLPPFAYPAVVLHLIFWEHLVLDRDRVLVQIRTHSGLEFIVFLRRSPHRLMSCLHDGLQTLNSLEKNVFLWWLHEEVLDPDATFIFRSILLWELKFFSRFQGIW